MQWNVPTFRSRMQTPHCQITLVNKGFAPWGKMSFSDVFLDAEFKHVPTISLSPTYFAPVNLLHQVTKVCFYRGRHEELKDFFSQDDGLVFCNDICSVMEILGHEITQICGICSLIHQKWAWRWFYSTTEINSPPFLWLMQPKEGLLWKHEATVGKNQVCRIYVEVMWWSQGCGTVTGNATRVHKILLFPVWVGQPRQEESLCK